MDRFIDVLNVACCALLAAASTWAILSPRVQDGVVIKSGLIFVALGFMGLGTALALDKDVPTIERTLGLLHVGLMLVAAGIALRWKRAGRVYRIDEWITPPTVVIQPRASGKHHDSTLTMQ